MGHIKIKTIERFLRTNIEEEITMIAKRKVQNQIRICWAVAFRLAIMRRDIKTLMQITEKILNLAISHGFQRHFFPSDIRIQT